MARSSCGGDVEIAAADMRQAAGDHQLVELLARGDAQALVVQVRALALLGEEQVVIGGIVDEACDQLAFALERDRHGEVRNAVQEVGGAVERIDDPDIGLVGAFARAAFLADEAVAGAGLGQFVIERLFGALVGEGDEVCRTFQRNLQILDLAEIALQVAAGAARGFHHDVEKG